MTRYADPIAWERSLAVRPSSPAWVATLRALYGTCVAAEAVEFSALAWREPPTGGSDELLAVVGRRGGKSETIARVAVFEAVHGGHSVALAPGQTALIPVISPLREQSQEILGYVRGLAALPQVRKFVDGDPTRDGVRFKSGVEIRVMTADSVAVSGPTVVCAVLDEFAKFAGDDSVTPDREIINSLRPALAPVAGAPRRRLIGITSAYIQDGLAFETDRDHFGKDSTVLVVRGTTAQFNPAIDLGWLDRERKRVGERVFAREYLAEWQPSITEGWFGQGVIERCIDAGRAATIPQPGIRYTAAIDAAFKGDRFALAIAHREKRPGQPALTIVDRVRAWSSPRGEMIPVAEVVTECVALLRRYGIERAVADQHSFPPLQELFRREGIGLFERAWTAQNKAPLYSKFRAEMAEALVRLPDDQGLIRELHNTQGHLLRSGGEQIGARVGHDDLADATVMCATLAMQRAPDRALAPGDAPKRSSGSVISFRSALDESRSLEGGGPHEDALLHTVLNHRFSGG